MVNKLCRLCAKETEKGVELYKEEGMKLNLSTKIIKCLQIPVCPEDLLPKMICVDCCCKLNRSSEFFEECSQAQTVLEMTVGTQKGAVANRFSQGQNPRDVKEFVECILLGNSNQPELTTPQPQTDVENQREDDVRSRRRRRRKSSNAVKCREQDRVQEETKGNLDHNSDSYNSDSVDTRDEVDRKQKESLRQRVRLEDCYTWQCTDCPTILSTLHELKDHHRMAHNKTVRYQCIECAKVYAVYKKFTRHVRLHRNYGKYRCDDCGKAFSSKQAMENHAVLHSGARPHSCSDCGKTFRQIGSLYSHRRVHQTGQNGFSCSECGKLLLSRQSLELHRKSHSGTRDYTCDICGKSFAVKQGLAYHMMSHSGERPHCCQICGKRCKTVYLLNKHMATHSDVKTHQCDVCGKQFRESSTLKLHTRIHTGAMPYRCEFCGRQFRFQGVYVIHRRQHTGERPYSCSECKRDFTNWANYNKHVKCRHHGKTRTAASTNKDQCSDTYKSCPVSTNQGIHPTFCPGSDPVNPSIKNSVGPELSVQNRAEPEVTFDDSTARLIGSLCPLQESSKVGLSNAVVGNHYSPSQLYSQIAPPAPSLSGYYFPSNVNNEYTHMDGLPD